MFRERLSETGAIQKLFDAFDRQLRDNGYLARGGQLVAATLVEAPRQRNVAGEKAAITSGTRPGRFGPTSRPRPGRKRWRPAGR